MNVNVVVTKAVDLPLISCHQKFTSHVEKCSRKVLLRNLKVKNELMSQLITTTLRYIFDTFLSCIVI